MLSGQKIEGGDLGPKGRRYSMLVRCPVIFVDHERTGKARYSQMCERVMYVR